MALFYAKKPRMGGVGGRGLERELHGLIQKTEPTGQRTNRVEKDEETMRRSRQKTEEVR